MNADEHGEGVTAQMASFVRIAILKRGEPFEILVNGRPVTAYEGESVAAALLAGSDDLSCHYGLFCGMGACFGCLVTVDGVPNVRSCATLVRPGLRVETPYTASLPSANADD
jgi:sarcosine oxidase subunit alpha